MKNTLLKKIVTLFLIFIIPLLAIGTYALHKINQNDRNKIIETMDSNNQTFLSQLDETLNQIYYTNLPVLKQTPIQKIVYINSYLSTYEKGVYINILREQLSAICATTPYLESAHMFFTESKTIYNSPGYELGSYQLMNEQFIAQIRQLHKEKGLIHYYKNAETGENELSILLTPSQMKMDYGLNLILSQEELHEYLKSNLTYENDFYYFSLKDSFTLTNYDDSITNLIQEWKAYDKHWFKTQLNDHPYYIFFYKLSYSDGYYIRIIAQKSLFKPVELSLILIILLYLAIFIFGFVFFAGIYRMVHKPLLKLTSAFNEIENSNFDIQISDYQSVDFSYLFSAFNSMSTRLKQLIEHDYNQKLLLQKSELKQLQAQINPHFLYNSFFMLQRMIKTDCTENAIKVSNALGTYFCYITKNCMDSVPFEEEYNHAKTYLYIQGLRFEGRIEITLPPLPNDFKNISVPKLILQPILENAFQYGLNQKIANGLLYIKFEIINNIFTIIIEDNGETLTDEALLEMQSRLTIAKTSSNKFEMSGILNIQRRLAILSNYASSLQVSRSELGGLKVCIFLSNA